MLSNLIKSKIKINSIEFGQLSFYIGTLLLATTNLIAGSFYLISLIISFKAKNNPLKKDLWNYLLLLSSIVFILSSIYISTTYDNNITYEVLKESSWEPISVWLNLFNWLPLFLAFSGFQIYLKTENQRMQFAKCLFLGLIPLLISIFLQKFGINGPFKFLNGLIVFYLYPIDGSSGYSGLFNNPNYTGLWLSASLPFCFALLKSYRFQKIKLGFIFTIFFTTIYCIFQTNSRNASIGILVSTYLMIGTKFLIFSLMFSILLYFIVLAINPIFFSGSSIIEGFTLDGYFTKLLKTNYFNKIQFPRIDIWQKASKLIMEKPLLGWGAATFPILYIVRGGLEKSQHTHSMPLEIAHNHGIPAALILMFFVSLLFIKGWRIIFHKNNHSQSEVNKAWITSLLIIVITHISDLTYYDGRVSLLIWILLAGVKCIIDEYTIKNNLKNQN